MTDRFDAGFDAPQKEPASPARAYDLVPRGTCRVEIVKADRKAVPWRATTANPTGECIVLRLRAAGGYSFMFVDLPDDKPWLRQHVARAVGIEVDLCVPEELTSRQAHVEIEHVQLRDGRTKAVVRKWLPARPTPQPPAQPQGGTATLIDAIEEWRNDKPAKTSPPAPRRSRNAVPRHGADDDIPF
jgi:hypothetical protein